MRARISSMLPTPLASPNSSHASETNIGAESLNKPPPTTLVCGEWVLKKNGSPGDTESAATTGLPEVHLGQLGPIREEAVPLVIGHADIRAHTGIMHSVRLGLGANQV